MNDPIDIPSVTPPPTPGTPNEKAPLIADPPPNFSQYSARAGGKTALVVTDIDGTLITRDKVLTPAAIDAVMQLKKAGIAFTAVSSRPPRGMAMLIAPLALEFPLGAFNGGSIFMPNMTIIEQQVIPREAALQSLAAIRAYGADPWIFSGDQWLISPEAGSYVDRERRSVQFELTVVESFAPWLDKAGKIVGASADFERLAECERALQQQLGEAATALRSQHYYLDITPPGTNKGYAIRRLARMMNIGLHEVAVIGDMANDLPMFSIAGLAIAMGNATDEVKAAADYVTTGCNEDGFANAINTFILNRPKDES